MSKCEMIDLDLAAKSIFDIIKNDERILKKDKHLKYEQLRPYIRIDNISYCIEKFIESELDYITKGERGLGRMTTAIPRLGGYYRKKIAEMSSKSRLELYMLIQDIMLRAYLVDPFFGVNPNNKPTIVDKTSLFKAWIPPIYVVDIIDPVVAMLDILESSAINSLEGFFITHKLENRKPFEDNERVSGIICRYMVAGYLLRLVEMDAKGVFSKTV